MDIINQIGGNSALGALDPSLTQRTPVKEDKASEVGQDEFLQLLVTQLKNQDPLDPVKNEDFAVSLAQFSQLEQLVQINNALGGAKDASNLTGYLGQQVVLNSSAVTVKGGSGGLATFELPSAVSGVKVELLDELGQVRDSFELPGVEAGHHTLELEGLSAPNGSYTVQVTALTATGATFTPEVFASGIVTGFRPGPDPKLLINDQEISTADIREVRAAL